MWKFIFIFIVFLNQSDLFSDTLDTNEVILLLEKTEYIEGDTILLTIEFDFNRGDSVIIFCPEHTFLFGVVITNELGQNLRHSNYYLSNLGKLICPLDSIRPNEIKRIETNLNKEFRTEESFGKDNYRNLLPGDYSIKFENDFFYYRHFFDRNAMSNELTFKVLPKN